jgi:hypothetical protein
VLTVVYGVGERPALFAVPEASGVALDDTLWGVYHEHMSNFTDIGACSSTPNLRRTAAREPQRSKGPRASRGGIRRTS